MSYKQSPVAAECICPGEDTRLGSCPYHGQRGWGNVPASKPVTGRAGSAEPPAKPEEETT